MPNLPIKERDMFFVVVVVFYLTVLAGIWEDQTEKRWI